MESGSSHTLHDSRKQRIIFGERGTFAALLTRTRIIDQRRYARTRAFVQLPTLSWRMFPMGRVSAQLMKDPHRRRHPSPPFWNLCRGPVDPAASAAGEGGRVRQSPSAAAATDVTGAICGCCSPAPAAAAPAAAAPTAAAPTAAALTVAALTAVQAEGGGLLAGVVAEAEAAPEVLVAAALAPVAAAVTPAPRPTPPRIERDRPQGTSAVCSCAPRAHGLWRSPRA